MQGEKLQVDEASVDRTAFAVKWDTRFRISVEGSAAIRHPLCSFPHAHQLATARRGFYKSCIQHLELQACLVAVKMTFSKDLAFRPSPVDDTTQEYFNHSSAQRVSTDTVIVEALKRQYPQLELTIAPAGFCNLLGYAANGHAKATPLEDSKSPLSSSQKWRQYVPPARRIDHLQGAIVDKVLFGKYMYAWKDHEFVLYVVNGRDGLGSYPQIINNYILSSVEKHVIDELITKASRWTIELHNEVWVFDRGYWQKSAELWQSVQQSEWEDVILDSEMKKSIIEDAEHFFISRDTYTDLRVPWKRGVIYYGPPGMEIILSIRQMLHTCYF